MEDISLEWVVSQPLGIAALDAHPRRRTTHPQQGAPMRRIALAALTLAALTLSPAASADHGHNCVWSGGAWVGQGLCPGMPGYEESHATPAPEPTEEPTPEPTQPNCIVSGGGVIGQGDPRDCDHLPGSGGTTPPQEPTTEPSPSPTATEPPARPQPNRERSNETVERARKQIEEREATEPSQRVEEIVVGPLVETDIVHYAPEVNPARILR